MSYSLLSFSPNEILTSAKMNQVSDNFEAIRDGSALQNDSIVEANIADGEVGDAKWRNGVAFRIYQSSNYSATAAAFYKIPFDTEVYDLGNNASVSTDRFVAPYNGIYHFSGRAGTTSSARGISTIYVNGVETARGMDGEGTNARARMTSTDLQLTAGDYVELYGWNTNSGTASGSPHEAWFCGHLVTRL